MNYKLKEVVAFKPGYAFKKGEMSDSGYPLIKIKSIKKNRVIIDPESCIIKDAANMSYAIHNGDILMALTGDPVTKGSIETWAGRTGLYENDEISFLNQRVCKIIANEEKIDSKYLLYWLIRPEKTFEIASLYHGSANQANISHKDVGELSIELPDLQTQKRVSTILSNIDKKIFINNYTNDNLYSIGETLFKEKIDSNSYAEKRKLRSFFPVVTGKKDANAATEDGKYPFFTCSRQISRINDYTFDSSAILLAGNGDFNVKFYRGKFDAYQRTYVLIPEDKLLLGYLYWAISIKLSDITSNFRGSVIRFITKGNIEDYEVAYLPDPRILNQFQSYLEMIEANNLENERLTKLRDTLLPELLNGKIDISNIDI